MSGSVIESVDAPQIIEHQNKALNFTPYDVRWVPYSARMAVLGMYPRGTGVLQVYEMRVGALTLVAEVEKPTGFKCGTFGASGLEERHLATGDYKGMLNIWDLERMDAAVYSVKAHESLVNNIDGCGGLRIGGGAPELATCGRDGCVRVWDPRVREPVLSVEPKEGEAARDCWTVTFGDSFDDDHRSLCAGYDNGDVKLFDLRTSTLRWETNVGNGVVCCEFDRKDIEMNKLVVTTLESKFRLFDMRTHHPETGFAHLTERAHKSTVWLVRHLPQNRDLFATLGGNGGINLYKYNYPMSRTSKDEKGVVSGVVGSVELLNARVLAPQPFVAFDWCAEKEGLAAATCLDQTLRVFIVTKLNKY